MTTIYLVRHCEALGNQQQVFQGSYDGPVTPAGEEQLREVSRRFADIPLDVVYASPLSRAQATARALIGARDIPLSIEPRMTEINGGDWERRPWEELPENYPEQSRLWIEEPWAFEAPNGEKMTEVYARVAEAMADIAAKHDGQTVAIASHGCAIRNALCFAHGKPVTALNDFAWSDNTAVSLLHFDGTWHIAFENDSSHLPKGSSKAEKKSWWRADAVQAK